MPIEGGKDVRNGDRVEMRRRWLKNRRGERENV